MAGRAPLRIALLAAGALAVAGGLFVGACGSNKGTPGFADASLGVDGGAGADVVAVDMAAVDAPTLNFEGGLSTEGGSNTPIPTTCAESITRHSYVGCDYWPTV